MIYETNLLVNRYDAEGSYDIEMEYDEAGNTVVNYDGYILVDELMSIWVYEFWRCRCATFILNYENRLIEVQTDEDETVVAYTYNALGRRSQKHDLGAGSEQEYTRK